MMSRTLTPMEARVLAVLMEKQHTVPDTYPLSVNALLAGSNQKTARNPVMEATEADVVVALDGLKLLHLVFEVSGSRVLRFEHNMAKGLGVPSQSAALLATLMLRGPQTAAELRLNSERLHRFADVSSVEAFLEELADKSPPRVLKLPRAPGEREARWVHLLCGEPPASPVAVAGEGGMATGVGAAELASLKTQLTHLSAEVAELRQALAEVRRELGMSGAVGSG